MNKLVNKTIVSLIASATEIISALNAEKKQVGRSHGCDFPHEILSLPVLTRATFPLDGTSIEIDSHVKRKLTDGLSVYEIDKELLARLAPDVILTQDQCDVCAASLRDVEDAVCEWIGKRAEIVSLKPEALQDVFDDIKRVAVALEIPERGDQVVAEMQARMGAVEKRAKKSEYKPRVACIEWIEPLMAAGNWMPELIEMAGGVNLFGEAGIHSPWMNWEDLIEANPDVILILPCGFSIERTMSEFKLLEEHEGWEDLKAVIDGHVYVIDGDQYCNRPGPRLTDSLEIIAEILHSEMFDFGHENISWKKCSNNNSNT